MPELPEVEAIRLQLHKYLSGHKILAVKINYRKKFEGNENHIYGAKVLGARRFGKVVVVDLDNGYSILTHVKMTGQYIYRGPNLGEPLELSPKVTGGAPGKHTHIIFKLDKDGVLYFNDVRKFGWIKIVPTKLVESEKFISSLGPEPLRNLTLTKFKEILSKSNRPVKILLMDQSKMGGVGNIYANDALWKAGINPQKPAKDLSSGQVESLFEAVEDVLKEGIRWGGASELAFVTPDGKEGQYQGHTLAYGHDGHPCERCKMTVFEKYFLGGRGTYWCPTCQK